MRKTIFSAAAIASAALLLTACGGGGGGTDATGDTDTATATTEATDEPSEEATEEVATRGEGDLVVWTDAVKAPGVQQIADAYGKANGITVTVQTIVNTRSDFVTANQAGNGPDVVVGAHDWIGQLVANSSIEPLQITADQLGAYAEQAVNAVRYDGQLYALPYGIESLLLYCNKEYAPDTYTSLEQVIAAGQAAKDAGKVESALNVPQGVSGDPYNMQPYFTSAGGYLFGLNADGSYNPEDLGVGTDAGIAAATKLATLGDAGSKVFSTAITNDNAISLFAEGKAACLSSGPWALSNVEDGLGADGFTIQPIPGFEGMSPAQPFMGVNSFYVASNGRNKTFAQDFVTSTAEGGVNTEASMKIMQDVTSQPSAMTSVLAQADDTIKTFGAAALTGAPMPAIPAMDAVWSPLGQAYAAIIGGADPASSMTAAADTIKAAIAAS